MKELSIRGLQGAVIGVFLIFSIGVIMITVNNENANISADFLLKQYVSGFAIGFAFGALNLLFVKDNVNILKTTFIHFLSLTIIFVVFGIYANWLILELNQIILTILIFITLYSLIWIICYIYYKKEIKLINKQLNS